MHCCCFIGLQSGAPSVRLQRLKLENWRGVTQREIEFSAGVTVVEGPNEIGKSTIVEALQALFNDLDSSKTQRIKAIAPVGQDVGSKVELALTVAEHQLIYAKTYNKKSATVLSVSGAQTLQLSGREAHEWVVEFLAAHVDMDLWRALLVDQSDTLGKANLQASQGLAKALDEAAGNSSEDSGIDGDVDGRVEDTTLYTAVVAEYEQYFTLKTGKPKAVLLELEKRVAQSEEGLAQAQAALQEIAADTQEQERCAAEVLRLQTQLPGLEAQAQAQEHAWTQLSSLQEQQASKQQELAIAQKLLQGLQQTLGARAELAQDILSSKARVVREQELGAPMQAKAQQFKSQMEATREGQGKLRAKLAQARASVNLAAADAQYYVSHTKLLQLEKNLHQLQGLEAQMSEHLKITKATNINDGVVEQFRAAETALAVVEGRRDTAATTFELQAYKTLTATVDGQEIELESGQQSNGVIAKEIVLDLPGTAKITLKPSTSVAEIQDALNQAQAQLASLSSTYAVAGSGPAQQINAQRHQAQTELDKLRSQQQQLLGDSSLVEIEHEVASLRSATTGYVAQRTLETELPSSGSDAQRKLEQAQKNQTSLEAGLEEQRQLEEEQRAQYDEVDADYRLIQQNLDGLSATLAEKQSRLAQEKEANSDEAAQAAMTAQQSVVTQLDASVAELAAAWQAANPEAVKELRDNARLVCARATEDLTKSQRRLDVLLDRLQHAQADGRFDAAEAADNANKQLSRELHALQRRAQAAKRLWTCLAEHRSHSRQAYVKPLKVAVEALGAIVFGVGFKVELDEDWSLVSRTLDGKTLPFTALSIGAREQLGILLRLAAGQVTADQGGVPLIIDDALGFSDPTRLSTMGAAIAAAGRKAQVIILTCTPGRFTHVGSAKVVVLD